MDYYFVILECFYPDYYIEGGFRHVRGSVLSHQGIKYKVQVVCVPHGKHPMLTIVGLHLVA